MFHLSSLWACVLACFSLQYTTSLYVIYKQVVDLIPPYFEPKLIGLIFWLFWKNNQTVVIILKF